MAFLRPHDRDEQSVSEQAARWIVALQTGGARERSAFANWLRASPQHVREYLLMTALEKELTETDLRNFDVEGLLARGSENVVQLPATEAVPMGRPGPGRQWRWAAGLVAGLAVLGVIGWQIMAERAGVVYETAIGEQRTFKLDDGSVIQLNPLSTMRVRFSAGARDIRLLSGEAIFKVEHDPARPFRVHTNDTLIEDIGTEFHVHRRSNTTVVSVIEGAVEVSAEQERKPFIFSGSNEPSKTAPADSGFEPLRATTRIDAGEEARIAAGGRAIKRREIDVASVTASGPRHLTFSGDTLADIVEDFNRYNSTPRIRLHGEALRARRFSGGFDADDPASLIEYLQRDGTIVVQRMGDEVVISQR